MVKTTNHNVFVIAEAGVNHNGSETLALELVEAAAECGADAVKFQTFSAKKLVRKGAKKAAYQELATGDGDQYDMLKKLEMSNDLHHKLISQCSKFNIEFMSTPFDEEATDFLLKLGMKRIKIPSGEITNLPFLRFLASKNTPIILSTGMATLDEVAKAVSTISNARIEFGYNQNLDEILTLLHCTSNYPTSLSDVNLRAMQTLAKNFSLPVGYSDHTLGVFVAPIAYSLGAVVIEKHFTMDRTLPGPDHTASLEPKELELMIKAINDTELLLGSIEKKPTTSELEVRKAVRRSVTLTKDVIIDTPLEPHMLTLMRPGNGIQPKDINSLNGRTLCRTMSKGDTLHWEDLVN